MRLPGSIAQPIFYLLYRYERRASPVAPIRREIHVHPESEKAAFDALLASSLLHGRNSLIDYHLPYPKLDFLNYLCDWGGYVAHGSINHELEVLQPIRFSTDSGEFGRREQIFCSPDGIWAMWFAILDKAKCKLTENGCVRVGSGPKRIKYYHFDLPVRCKYDPPFVEGMIYLANATDFPFHRTFPLLDWFDAEIEEWGSTNPVTPLARLAVKPDDFPYLDRVQFRL